MTNEQPPSESGVYAPPVPQYPAELANPNQDLENAFGAFFEEFPIEKQLELDVGRTQLFISTLVVLSEIFIRTMDLSTSWLEQPPAV